jgi:hypothetical protein
MLAEGSPNVESVDARAIRFMIQNSIIPQADQAIDRAKFIGGMDPTKHNIVQASREYIDQHPFFSPDNQAISPAEPSQQVASPQVQQAAQAEISRRAATAELKRRQGGTQ